jgi:Protein of unknown function (DUF3500)
MSAQTFHGAVTMLAKSPTSESTVNQAVQGSVTRREFLKIAAAGGGAVLGGGWTASATAGSPAQSPAPETVVARLYKSLSDDQKKQIAFPWDYVATSNNRGLLRTRVAANWRITEPKIKSDFYTPEQQQMIREVFEGIIHSDWHARFDKQLADDDEGFGTNQRIAIFGTPDEDKFEFVLTGRHMTIRCDGNSAEHVALGGPIFYGHAAEEFNEKPDHPGNVFWHQALAANRVYQMLDGKQRKLALIANEPKESAVSFQGSDGPFSGIPVSELSSDQKEHVQTVLKSLLEPYRQSDQDEVVACLKTQGGLDRCHLAFFEDADVGNDGVWDVWRLEGPAFVWHFRGKPHVHTWVNVSADPSVELNA